MRPLLSFLRCSQRGASARADEGPFLLIADVDDVVATDFVAIVVENGVDDVVVAFVVVVAPAFVVDVAVVIDDDVVVVAPVFVVVDVALADVAAPAPT